MPGEAGFILGCALVASLVIIGNVDVFPLPLPKAGLHSQGFHGCLLAVRYR